MNINFKVGELKAIIAESSNEFKPVLGNQKPSKNKSHKKAESEKKTEKKLGKKMDGNRTLWDIRPDVEVSDKDKKRFDSNFEGYSSELEKNNGIPKASCDFGGNKAIKKQWEDSRDEYNDTKMKLAKSGLTGRTLSDKDITINTINEKKMTKRLTFKRTKFLNEESMLKRIPDEYKVDGQKIYMKDGHDNEYLVECTKNSFNGNVEANVVSYNNKKAMNECVDRIFGLMNYDTKAERDERNYHTNEHENGHFNRLMCEIREK